MNRILAIAINHYDDPTLGQLHNCNNDINTLTSTLSSHYQFDDIEILSNREQTAKEFLHDYLYDYFLNALEEDNILLIFAGHGQLNEKIGSSYWMPSDAVASKMHTWLSLADVLNFISHSEAFHVNIISDSCFSGAIFDDALRGGGPSAFESKKSRLALTSGSREKVSDGPKGGLSPFTETLNRLLNENEQPELPFTKLATDLLMGFKPEGQTPMFGSLQNIGHKGGSMVLHKKLTGDTDDSQAGFSETSIALNIDLPLIIDYQCSVPLFKESKSFDHLFVNAFVQQHAYGIISDVRRFFTEDPEYFMERNKEIPFDLSIGYSIHTLSDKMLSMTFSTENYFGGAHPNSTITSLNIAFSPERIFRIPDIVKYEGSFKHFLNWAVENFSVDSEQREILLNLIEDELSENLDFSIDEKELTLYFTGHLPRVMMPHGFLEIPLEKLHMKI